MSKNEQKARNKQSWEGKFLFQKHYSDLTPPPPLDGPTIIKPTIDIESLCAHRLYSSQIVNLTPLLVPYDMGITVEDFFLARDELTMEKKEMAPEDDDILNEKVMWVRREGRKAE